MIAKALHMIAGDEGFRPRAYRHSLVLLTIGYGFMIDPDHPGAIEMPEHVAWLWLSDIVNRRANDLDAAIPWWRRLSETRQAALLDMAYQLGVAGLLKFTHMLDALRQDQFEEAGKHARDSLWYRQTPQRAERIIRILEGTQNA